ncbi:MAG: serine hydrolase [Acidobacteria bacterium]|nr:serine hydrolase [Acidobacteriota bacterium]
MSIQNANYLDATIEPMLRGARIHIQRGPMRSCVVCCVIVFFLSPCAVAQVSETSGSVPEDLEIRAAVGLLDARLGHELRERRVAGMSVAVVYDQEVIWMKGYGFEDVENKVPATPKTVYRVASITKLFTATMLMQLRDAGRIQLDDPVTKYVPELRLTSRYEGLPPITLLQLATHTSGFPREAPMDYWRTLKFPTIEKMTEALTVDGERIFPPYKEWKYSNVGYGVLGLALSRAVGVPYFSYVQTNILKPLEMNNSGFTPPTSLAIGYFLPEPGEQPKPAYQPDYGGYGPATSLYSTAEDMARFISLQFRDGPPGGQQILRGSTLREMHSAHWVRPDWKGGQGIGFAIRRVGPFTAIGHGGGIQGFRTDISLIPSLKLGVAVFTNTNCDPNKLTDLALSILGPVIENAQERSVPQPPAAPAQWKRYVGVYAMAYGSKVCIRLRRNRLELIPAEDGIPEVVKLNPEGEHRFRMKGGSVSGEILRFEVDSDGSVNHLWMGQYPADREDDVVSTQKEEVKRQ